MQKINFQNLPSTTTPLNATNLNAIQTNVENVFNGNVPAGEMKVEGLINKNLLTHWDFVKGRYNSNDGSIDYASGTDSVTKAATYLQMTTNAAYRGVMTQTYIDASANTDYFFSCTLDTTGATFNMCCYDSSRNFLGVATKTTISSTTAYQLKFTTLASTRYIRLDMQNAAASTRRFTNIQLEKGSEKTSYVQHRDYSYFHGTTDNGDYLLYDDGTLICWGTKEVGSVAITSASGNLFISSALSSISFPRSFIEPPTLNMNVQSASAGCFLVKNSTPTTNSTGQYYLAHGNSRTANNVVINFHAIGRWK